MSKDICPVPRDQRPLNEFNSISSGGIISWPLLDKKEFYSKLLFSLIITSPISMIICYGSNHLKNDIIDFILVSIIGSFILPLLLLVRQWLSWNYILKRLNSENIEYEESGWYDGQTWEKPLDWRAKDLLIAQHQVKPIINHIRKIIFLLIMLISFTSFLTLSS
tara:strand:- start:1062 stop:1553 length:492 start_codon:yes stop_codon:yes gene_type:complete